MNNKISDKDKKDWENFISRKENIRDKDSDYLPKNKIEKITFDLHGYSLNDANKEVESLINKSYELGIRKLTIITGKGIHSDNEKDPYVSKDLGKLKFSVPHFIKTDSQVNELILSVDEAAKKDGGKGAILIKLKFIK